MNPSQDQEHKEEENPGDDFVMYTRRGVQRLSKNKRGTGTIATQQRHSSSTSQPASKPSQTTSQRARGRGRNT